MLKASLQTILTIVLGFIVQNYFPFWSIAAVAGVIALFFKYENSAASFAAGFASCSLLWSAYAVTLSMENGGILGGKLAELFRTDSSYLPYATGLVGGVLGGMGAMTGSLARKIFS